MKKFLLAALCLGFAASSYATVTIDFNIGAMTLADGTTPIPEGSLIQLIAAPTSGGLTGPTAASFISGSEILLISGVVDGSSFLGLGTGTTDFAPGPLTITAGYALMIQWFPTLTSGASTPGNSTPYGLYGALNDASWVAPANGSTLTFSFLTTSITGSVPDSAGASNLTTAAAAPIPEPATYAAIMGAMVVGFATWRRRQLAA